MVLFWKTLFIMRKIILFFILTVNIVNICCAESPKFILQDECINILYEPAISFFSNSNICVLRDSRGIILRFGLENPQDEHVQLSALTMTNISMIEDFLAKIKNPVIIEVHTAKNGFTNVSAEKKWEISAVIAGKLEQAMCCGEVSNGRIHSVGYGEFLPENNTSYNGGKLLNRVDIIILCNVSGE